jgi:hypothetical protein
MNILKDKKYYIHNLRMNLFHRDLKKRLEKEMKDEIGMQLIDIERDYFNDLGIGDEYFVEAFKKSNVNDFKNESFEKFQAFLKFSLDLFTKYCDDLTKHALKFNKLFNENACFEIFVCVLSTAVRSVCKDQQKLYIMYEDWVIYELMPSIWTHIQKDQYKLMRLEREEYLKNKV